MSADEKVEALKADLDQLYEIFAAQERTMKQLIEHIDLTFTRLGVDISALQQVLRHK